MWCRGECELNLPGYAIDSAATDGIREGIQSARDLAHEELISKVVNPGEFEAGSLNLTRNNGSLVQFLRSFTHNSYYCRLSGPKRARVAEQYVFAFELMVGWLTRLFNVKLWVFPCVILSLWALRCRVSRPF